MEVIKDQIWCWSIQWNKDLYHKMIITEVTNQAITGRYIEVTDGRYGYAVDQIWHCDLNNLSYKTLFEYLTVCGWVLEQTIKKSNQDGMSCSKCHLFYSFVEPNQPDGAHICYECRRR